MPGKRQLRRAISIKPEPFLLLRRLAERRDLALSARIEQLIYEAAVREGVTVQPEEVQLRLEVVE